MARQDGIILLTGPVGNLSFYKMNGEYFARRKSGVSGERIKSDPAYARTRENIAEFGHASGAAKLVRRAFWPAIRFMADCRVTGRLTAAMLRVIKTDDVSVRGQRRVSNGKTAVLKGFEFNKNCKLAERFLAPFTASIDRAAGTMSIDIPAFVPTDMVSAPSGATHFRLKAGGAAIDFDNNQYFVATCETTEIAIAGTRHEPLKLSMSVPGSSQPVFVVLGIEFLQSVNETCYPLSTTFNAMAIVKVDDCPAHDLLRKAVRVGVTRQVHVLPKKSLTRRKSVPFNRNRVSTEEHVTSGSHNSLKALAKTRNIRTRDG